MIRTRRFGALLTMVLLATVWAAQPRVRAEQTSIPGEMFFATVSVTDSDKASGDALRQQDFHLTENKKDRKLQFFGGPEKPSAIGIILGAGASSEFNDAVSLSVNNAIQTVRESGNPTNEYFVTSFGFNGVRGALSKSQQLARSPNPRKAVLMIIDGYDEPGREDSMESIMKQGIPIYFAFVTGIRSNSTGVRQLVVADSPGFIGGPVGGTGNNEWLNLFKDVARNTGGQMLFSPLYELEATCRKVAEEIRNQYALVTIQQTVTRIGVGAISG
jgi:hypothetical protein